MFWRDVKRVCSVGSTAMGLLACGAHVAPVASKPGAQAQVAQPATTIASVQAAPAPPPEPPPPQETPGFAEALATLRPAGTAEALQRLQATPEDPEAHAAAALAYATTDAPGMSLIWALEYQAMGGTAASKDVAAAVAKVLNERIVAVHDEKTKEVRFNVRLAPGAMPVRQMPDGSALAPVAHVFETLFSPAVTNFRPPWNIEQFYDALSSWAGVVASHGTPLDTTLEIDRWLVATARAEQLEVFCYELLGPAFAPEYKAFKAKHGRELNAYRVYLKQSQLVPKHAVMPDELIKLTPPSGGTPSGGAPSGSAPSGSAPSAQ
jgi:hypothetical protein